MACRASCGGNWSTQPFQRIKMASSPCKVGSSSSFFCSKSNHDKGPPAFNVASCTKASSGKLNSGDLSTRASDRSCCGDTSTSSSATMSCTSQQSISSVFSPMRAAMPSVRNSSCKGPRPARLRDSTITSCGLRPCDICSAIHRAAWRASSVRRVSSGTSRGTVRLSRHPGSAPPLSSCAVLALSRGMGGSRKTCPTASEPVVCALKPR